MHGRRRAASESHSHPDALRRRSTLADANRTFTFASFPPVQGVTRHPAADLRASPDALRSSISPRSFGGRLANDPSHLRFVAKALATGSGPRQVPSNLLALPPPTSSTSACHNASQSPTSLFGVPTYGLGVMPDRPAKPVDALQEVYAAQTSDEMTLPSGSTCLSTASLPACPQRKLLKHLMSDAVREIVVKTEAGRTLRLLTNTRCPRHEIAYLYSPLRIELFFPYVGDVQNERHSRDDRYRAVRIHARALTATLPALAFAQFRQTIGLSRLVQSCCSHAQKNPKNEPQPPPTPLPQPPRAILPQNLPHILGRARPLRLGESARAAHIADRGSTAATSSADSRRRFVSRSGFTCSKTCWNGFC